MFSYSSISKDIREKSSFFACIDENGDNFDLGYDLDMDIKDIKLCISSNEYFISNLNINFDADFNEDFDSDFDTDLNKDFDEDRLIKIIKFCHMYDIQEKVDNILGNLAIRDYVFFNKDIVLQNILKKNKYQHIKTSLFNCHHAVYYNLLYCLKFALKFWTDSSYPCFLCNVVLAYDSPECIKYLIDSGYQFTMCGVETAANLGLIENLKIIDKKVTEYSIFALQCALIHDHYECAKFMLNKVNIEDFKNLIDGKKEIIEKFDSIYCYQ